MIAKQKYRREKTNRLKKNAIFFMKEQRNSPVKFCIEIFLDFKHENMGEYCQSHFDMRHSLNHFNDLNIFGE